MCGIFCFWGKNPPKQLLPVTEAFKSLQHRGPDNTQLIPTSDSGNNAALLGFHRLAIMDTSPKGNQPFVTKEVSLACNGEIYNSKQLRAQYPDYDYQSDSDCEVIIPLYLDRGIEGAARALDGEFAFVLYDHRDKKVYAARDPIGIRPLFYGLPQDHLKVNPDDFAIAFASEAKALSSFCDDVKPFLPDCFYDGQGVRLRRIDRITHQRPIKDTLPNYLTEIRTKFIEGVRKRLTSDVPLGFLLSGGLDSSLVCSIATKLLDEPITTFSIGIEENPIDVKYAKEVADYLGSTHHEVLFTEQEVLDVLDELIYHLESWDITTVRASVGMYLLCKYIREKTDIKVVLTGEVSDELFGYKYTDFAPSGEEFQKEAIKRVEELHVYDVLRADRCIAAHGLEARVPFSDRDFVRYVMAIPGDIKMNTYGIEKALLRNAFHPDSAKEEFLKDNILFRAKAAFSDAVGHRMVDLLKETAEAKYTEADLKNAEKRYPHCPPFTKESLMYREIFAKHFPNQDKLIPDYWMPNKSWENCDVSDPSARALPNYGKSGN